MDRHLLFCDEKKNLHGPFYSRFATDGAKITQDIIFIRTAVNVLFPSNAPSVKEQLLTVMILQ